ncbi:hypothetical protein [Planococcus maritimus]|nr:hypothetical protein [Planococcus maritimus]
MLELSIFEQTKSANSEQVISRLFEVNKSLMLYRYHPQRVSTG